MNPYPYITPSAPIPKIDKEGFIKTAKEGFNVGGNWVAYPLDIPGAETAVRGAINVVNTPHHVIDATKAVAKAIAGASKNTVQARYDKQYNAVQQKKEQQREANLARVREEEAAVQEAQRKLVEPKVEPVQYDPVIEAPKGRPVISAGNNIGEYLRQAEIARRYDEKEEGKRYAQSVEMARQNAELKREQYARRAVERENERAYLDAKLEASREATRLKREATAKQRADRLRTITEPLKKAVEPKIKPYVAVHPITGVPMSQLQKTQKKPVRAMVDASSAPQTAQQTAPQPAPQTAQQPMTQTVNAPTPRSGASQPVIYRQAVGTDWNGGSAKQRAFRERWKDDFALRNMKNSERTRLVNARESAGVYNLRAAEDHLMQHGWVDPNAFGMTTGFAYASNQEALRGQQMRNDADWNRGLMLTERFANTRSMTDPKTRGAEIAKNDRFGD